MRIHFLLPGMHRVNRGAEVAFEAIATEIAKLGLDDVTVVGSGESRSDRPYQFERVGLIPRERFERFPKCPPFRSNYVDEEVTWVANYVRKYRPSAADITVTCSYPFVNWMLTRWPPFAQRPAHVFVTQNGDWPAYSDQHEYRWFRCDGLVCTNPVYYDRNRSRWPSVLLPNGIDPLRFYPGARRRQQFDLPESGAVVLMVSALVESKRVLEGIRVVARIPDAMLIVAGDGPLRNQCDALANELMPGRYRRMLLSSDRMPDLYRSSDVLLHPTLHESFGNVYVEAMAVGLPVVAHDYEVTRWIFGAGDNLVDASDDVALLGAVQRALSEGARDAAARLAAGADRFAWAKIALEYREFLVAVYERHRRGCK